jgi:PPOX class probable F420-dependent enzyme
MAAEVPEKIRKAIEGKQFWHLATVNPDGSPQVSTIWVNPGPDGNILINTALGRKKPRNIERNPHVALSWVDPDNGYHCASIQGKVVDSYTGDQAEADIDSLAEKYLGETPYPWRQPGEQRVTYVVEPTHVYHQDYE